MPTDEFIDSECPECAELLEALSEYIEGGLAEELRSEVVMHAQTCPQCGRLLFSLRRLIAYCQVQPNCEMPAQVRQQLWIAIRQELYSPPGDQGA